MSLVCNRSGQSIVGLIDGITSRVEFWWSEPPTRPPDYARPSVMFCAGSKSVDRGANYVTVLAQCTSSMSGKINAIFLTDVRGLKVVEITIPETDVQQGWRLYASIRLGWS